MKIARKFLASVICPGHTITSTEKVSTLTGCADEKKTPLQEPDFKKEISLPLHGNPIKNNKHHDKVRILHISACKTT
jgi:hypothetical protein